MSGCYSYNHFFYVIEYNGARADEHTSSCLDDVVNDIYFRNGGQRAVEHVFSRIAHGPWCDWDIYDIDCQCAAYERCAAWGFVD